jgi:hypothetical protein
MWLFMFEAGRRLPRDEVVTIFTELAVVLPCVRCRVAYNRKLLQTPLSQIHDAASAVKWVWIVKNSVNEATSRSSTSLAVIEARLNVFTQTVSAHDVLDCLAFLAFGLETPAQAHSYVRIATPVCHLASMLEQRDLALPSPKPVHATPHNAWLHALECRNELRRARREPLQTRDEFRQQFGIGIA